MKRKEDTKNKPVANKNDGRIALEDLVVVVDSSSISVPVALMSVDITSAVEFISVLDTISVVAIATSITHANSRP